MLVAPHAAGVLPEASVAPDDLVDAFADPSLGLFGELADGDGHVDHVFLEEEAAAALPARLEDVVQAREGEHVVALLKLVVDAHDRFERLRAGEALDVAHVREDDADLGHVAAAQSACRGVGHVAELAGRLLDTGHQYVADVRGAGSAALECRAGGAARDARRGGDVLKGDLAARLFHGG